MIGKLFDTWRRERSYLRGVAANYGVPAHWYDTNARLSRRISAALRAAGNNVRRVRLTSR